MADARREANERVGGRYEARVLEPSPPAIDAPPWFGDDPTARDSDPRSGLEVVSPVTTGDLLWDDLIAEDASLADFCSERWLGAYRRIEPAPAPFVITRGALHRLAEHVLAPTRARANGRDGLRWTRGGFGTPYFGNDAQLRVEGDILVLEVGGGGVHRGQLTNLRDAAEFVGYDLTRWDVEDDDTPLLVDPASASWLGDWLGLGCSVLEQLRAETTNPTSLPPVELDPETFELRLELARGVTCAWSPGDEHDPRPRLRVRGAELILEELLEADDQRSTALEFARSQAGLDGGQTAN